MWKNKGDEGFERDIDNQFECAKYLAQLVQEREGFELILEVRKCFLFPRFLILLKLLKKKKSVIMQEENLNVYFLCFAASVHQRVFLLYSQETAGSRKNSRVVEWNLQGGAKSQGGNDEGRLHDGRLPAWWWPCQFLQDDHLKSGHCEKWHGFCRWWNW